jgi:hypothetical protein
MALLTVKEMDLGHWWFPAEVGPHLNMNDTPCHSCTKGTMGREQARSVYQEESLKKGCFRRDDRHARTVIMEYGTMTQRSSYV